MDLYIDLEKGQMNRGKLIQRRTMVRGKNGKIYYRMQWVDPRTGEPVSKESHSQIESEGNHRTQKELIDERVKKMSRDEKYAHINKHGLTWKRNEHPSIDHKNAVEALKNHFYKNPHLLGAEHLPKEDDPNRTKDGGELVTDFMNSFKKRPEALYKMMKELGIEGASEGDPRLVDEWKPKDQGGNGMGAIRHMKNMMDLKKLFKSDPGVLDKMRNHPEYGTGDTQGANKQAISKPQPKPTPTQQPKTQAPPKQQSKPEPPKNTAQKGGNTIKGILDSMSSEDKYKLCKKLGIADSDPRNDPNIKEQMRPIHHMRNMMELKKAIEKDPSLLNVDPDTGGLSEDEKERLAGLPKEEKLKDEVTDFLNRASRDLKLQWASDYADHDLMKNRKSNQNTHIDNMHKIDALKKILMQDPSIMEELKPELENEELSNMKIGNKMMQKILIHVVGLKGIGDVVAGYTKGREWEWGDESSAMIQDDDDGNPILSIFHVDKEGKEHDLAIPLKKVKEYMDGLKNGEHKEITPDQLPLHKRSLKNMWDALDEDFDKNYTKEVGNALKKSVSDMWVASGKSAMLSSIAAGSLDIGDYTVNKDTLEKLFNKYGVTIDKGFVARVDSKSDAFKKVVYGHLVEKTKTKDAMQYLQKDESDRNDTWVLHESAKHWSPEERTEARKDFIKGNLNIEGLDKLSDADHRKVKITDHLHKSLQLYPFDLMTDVFANGCSLNFLTHDGNGNKHNGNFHSTQLGGIKFDYGYIQDLNSLSEEHPLYHKPAPREVYDSKGNLLGKAQYHPFSDTAAHEFAHAVDNYLSGGSRYLTWDRSDTGRKYAGKHANVVHTSYDKAVSKSNPKAKLGFNTGAQKYLFHLDEWMTQYEGRIYDHRYYGDNPQGVARGDGNSVVDGLWGKGGERGLEHWSENVSRAMNAYHAYKEWKDLEGDTSTDFDSWAGRMYDEYTAEGYGDEANSKDTNPKNGKYLLSYRTNKVQPDDRPLNKMPLETYGYLWHVMNQRHPDMVKGIKHILLRPDFLGDKSVGDPISRAEKDDYTRKSEVDLLIDLED